MSTGHKGNGHESKHKKSNKRSQRKTKRNESEKSSSTFKGESAELKGNVFETFAESKDTTQFERTMKALQVYVAGNFRHGGDIGWMLKHEKEFQFVRPNPPSSTSTTTRSQDSLEQDIYKEQIKGFVTRKQKYDENKDKLYAVIWGQCSENMQSKLQSNTSFQAIDEHRSCLLLLKEIKGVMFNFESQQYPIMSMSMAAQKYYNIKQGRHESLTAYYKRFKTCVEVLEHYGASEWSHPSLILNEYRKDNDTNMTIDRIYDDATKFKNYLKIVKGKSTAFMLLKGARKERFGTLIYDLKSQYARDVDHYPTDLNQALQLLSTHEEKTNTNDDTDKSSNTSKKEKNKESTDNAETEEVAFVQSSSKGKTPECFFCGGDHFLNKCPYRHQMKRARMDEEREPAPTTCANAMLIQDDSSCVKDDEHTMDNIAEDELYDFAFTCVGEQPPVQPITNTQQIIMSQQSHGKRINPNWILLDSQSTINIFNNRKLFKYIRPCNKNETVRCYCNGGYQDTNEIGEVPGIGMVYYNQMSLANILSLSHIDNMYRVTYDSAKEKAFIVHGTNSGDKKFIRSTGGLHYYDTKKENSQFIMMQTVKENESIYSKRDLMNAKKAINLYHAIGRPGYKAFYDTLQKGLIRNCAITLQDAKNAFQIYGPDEGAIMGKTTREKPQRVDINELYQLPIDFITKYRHVTLAIDILFFDTIPFLLTISRDVHFHTIEKLPDRENKTILAALQRVISIYNARGFFIQFILADGEFRHMSGDIMTAFKCHLNCTSAGEHVPEAERAVRVIKERIRCVVNTWPYKQVPIVFKVNLIKFVIFWINSIPQVNSIIPNVCSRAILTGQFPDYNKHCSLSFGEYVHVHNPKTITNTMAARTSPAIALGPTSNIQGGHRFYCLESKRIMTRRQWVKLPLPDTVITQINDISMKERSRRKSKKSAQTPVDTASEYVITHGDGNMPGPSHTSSLPTPMSVPPQYIHPDPMTQPVTAVTADDNSPHDDDNANNDHNPMPENDDDDHVSMPDIDAQEPKGSNDNHSENDETAMVVPDESDINGTNDPNDHETSGSQNDAISTQNDAISTQTPSHEHNTRGKLGIRPTQYDKVYGQDYTFAVALTQMSAKRGIKRFGQMAVDALAAEWKQLDSLSVFKPRKFASLSKIERRGALRTVQLIKEKKDGRIKGRTCVNGSRQRLYTAEEDASSPTVSTEALLLTAAIDAAERRFVATCDITGAFLKAYMDEFVLIVLYDEEIDALLQANPKYEKFVQVLENGRRVLYLELIKAMYGCLKSARLFWDHLSNHLSKMGFTQNQYDLCVANKIIEGKQCTVAWHVDDLKISHSDEKVVRQIIQQLEKEYGTMTVTTGKVHTYCGMDLIFDDGELKVDMRDYLRDTIAEFPEDCSKPVTTPAAVYLFEVTEDQTKLDEQKRKTFHTFVAKLLFVSKRGRPDIQVAIAFLSTRVTAPDDDDWKKLVRVLKYVNNTIDIVLTLSINAFNIIKWWIDTSYAPHVDCRSHTGGTMSLGKGCIYSTSCKQKINARSSTEAELIGVNDVLGQIIWSRNFITAQGYTLEPSTIYQDNKSAMLLEKNGVMSSSKRTKHINVRYYFIKDYVDRNEVQIIHCPTEDMVGDYFTKPLQGSQFVKFRDMIMGCKCFDTINKERVDETVL